MPQVTTCPPINFMAGTILKNDSRHPSHPENADALIAKKKAADEKAAAEKLAAETLAAEKKAADENEGK